MQTIHQTYHSALKSEVKRKSLFSRFISWCEGQEEYRFGWLAVILTFHGCVLTPLTIFAVFTTGNSIVLFCIAMGAMAISLISNLAAMPTKFTIPIFFTSIAIDLVVLAICIKTLFI